MEHLITYSEVLALSRPTSIHLSEEDVNTFIDESEQMEIIPAIGADLYLNILEDETKHEVLLNGGNYTGADGKKRIFKGLKTALAYYVYAKMVKNDGRILGESGFLSHNDEHASRIEEKQKYVSYNDALNVARRYLSDVLEYLKSTQEGFDRTAKVKNNGVRFIAIGD